MGELCTEDPKLVGHRRLRGPFQPAEHPALGLRRQVQKAPLLPLWQTVLSTGGEPQRRQRQREGLKDGEVTGESGHSLETTDCVCPFAHLLCPVALSFSLSPSLSAYF